MHEDLLLELRIAVQQAILMPGKIDTTNMSPMYRCVSLMAERIVLVAAIFCRSRQLLTDGNQHRNRP
jgi:hypothetical protein